MTLHDELQRIADRAPVADVPSDTWRRARRARTRDRALALSAAAAAVALVIGAVTWLPHRAEPPIADSDALGVPDHLYAVPERMSDRDNDGSWMRDEVTDDPTVVGVGAAAWVTYQGLPVVVGAADGRYHLLDLPDFVGNNWASAVGLDSPVVALSPDGRELAYGYAVFGADSTTEPIPSGIRVVDLTTGDLRQVPVPGKEGTVISRIEWSPGGSWLAFTGVPQDTWTRMSMASHGRAVLGRIAPDAQHAETRAVGNSDVPLSVDDGGTVLWRNGGLHTWGTGRPRPGSLEALGRIADGRWLVRTGTADNDVLSVTDPDTGRRHILVDIIGIDGSLSVATDLMPPNRLTVHRPEPDWPVSEERLSLLIGLGVAAAIAVLL
ncbi:hypothetical protein, partial [Nocardioides sp.]|uniref:hypothetical protein n=1 Tax=Nocardioides sp. TaxID=35761 RepID=UPI002ED9AE5F